MITPNFHSAFRFCIILFFSKEYHYLKSVVLSYLYERLVLYSGFPGSQHTRLFWISAFTYRVPTTVHGFFPTGASILLATSFLLLKAITSAPYLLFGVFSPSRWCRHFSKGSLLEVSFFYDLKIRYVSAGCLNLLHRGNECV